LDPCIRGPEKLGGLVMRVSRLTIVLVLAAVAALLVTAVAIHGNGNVSAWHSRLRAAIHGER